MKNLYRKATNKEILDSIKTRQNYWDRNLFAVVDIIDELAIPEMKRRGFDEHGNRLPYPYKPGENPDSLVTRVKRWWYYTKQAYYEDGGTFL